ncbi:serine/threonine protein kinase [Embleya sp. NBC_00888]|uniref:serine/threonine-protein kinase n=1 Tax=Embleya sp. NBC_00888 TaxID=2975960 RepID=UPI003864FBC0|nr:serine/threonine protein kinase [Embleya sp. NBC_00888]
MKPLEPEDPRRIGGYRVLRVLGAGGMGRVYLGRNRGGRIVAIKVVRAEWADDPGFRERFRREVDAARRVGGAWTAPVLDADTEAGTPWVVTGYVAGPSVYEAVAGRGPLPEETVRTLGSGLAEALVAVHGAGLVHRDIKPSNVLLSLDGPRVIDFGISRAMDASVLTRTGHTVGSPGFMSPEQVDGRDIGPPSDVFSLGSVLVFAATGAGPFGEGSGQALMYRIVAQEPRLDEMPAALREIVAACMTKHAASRPTPAELLAALAPDGTRDLVAGNWLPPDLTTALSRRAIELLELDEDGAPDAGTFVATGSGAPTGDDRPPETAASATYAGTYAGSDAAFAKPAQTSPAHAPPSDLVFPGSAAAAPPPSGPAPETYVLRAASQPAAPPPWWRRPWLITLVAVLIAGAVVLALPRLWTGDEDDPSTAREGAGGSGTSTSPPTGSGTLPSVYKGTWSGTMTSQLGSVSTVTVTLTGGKVGDRKVGVSKLTATGLLGEQADCESDLELLSVGADTGVELTSHLTRNQGCADGRVILKEQSPTTLSYVAPASVGTSESRGTLTRKAG